MHKNYDKIIFCLKEMIKYFNKPLEEVTIEELRDFLYKYLLNERKLADRTVNYYNSIIIDIILYLKCVILTL